jgi:two-component system nitrogen regulation sensor histidine kinase NtrY
MTTPAPKETKRRKRELIIIVTITILITLITYLETKFLHFGGLPISNTVLMFILININMLLLLLLIFLVLRNVVKLIYERKRKVIGAKLRTKLVIAFVGMALLPTILLFFVSIQVITANVEFWFNVPMEQSLNNSLAVAQHLYQHIDSNNQFVARKIADDIATKKHFHSQDPDQLKHYLQTVQTAYHIQGIEIYSARSERLVLVHERGLNGSFFDMLSADLIQRVLQEKRCTMTISKIPPGELVKTLCSVGLLNEGEEREGVVVISTLIAEKLTEHLLSIGTGIEEYQQLKMLRRPIRLSHFITLAIIALLIIFGATWLGFYLAKTITTPIQALAEGTHRIADGDLNFTIEEIADDEVGTLVNAFNKMTRDLRIGKEALERYTRELREANREAEQKRCYMETVLENISAGVISLNANGLITTINKSAEKLLGLKSEEIRNKSYKRILKPDLLAVAEEIRHSLASAPGNAIERPLRINLKNRIRTLMIHVTALQDESGRDMGLVLVFDDLTQLERAQRMAAWREVARRIAHEVKNPLTPIKLSAQRIRRKYGPLLQDDVPVFDECTQTIINQVDQIRNLVNEFSTFARMPNVDPRPASLPQIIQNTLILYREGHPHITFQTEIGPNIPILNLDKEQMKRVLINLFDNAIAAIHGKGTIRIIVSFDSILKLVRMEVADTGTGISSEDKLRLFEPYFSTKKSGMGLGLAIVNSIITDHKGFIRVRDNDPAGTIFVIELPV